jgi:hypothetical protein
MPASGGCGIKAIAHASNGVALRVLNDAGGEGLRVDGGTAYFFDGVTLAKSLSVGGASTFNGYATFNAGHGPHADLAERYPGRGVAAADVVAIGADGKLLRCTKECDAAVAGIVSSAPTMALEGTSAEREPVVPLALAGVVLCKVDASKASIRPGDLLVSSSTPGHAMRCTSRRPAAGTVIGKALEGLDKGTGVIQVLVTLR